MYDIVLHMSSDEIRPLGNELDMPDKSVSLSVRLTSDEAAFLAGYTPQGATTLSEKVRTVIAEAKQRRAGSENYADSLSFTEGLMGPAMHRLREIEAAHNIHSELLLALGHWLPDATASLIANVPSTRDKQGAEKLKKLEAMVADRVFALIEQILRLAVTGQSPCYDPSVVVSRTSTVVDLSEIIKHSSSRK